MFAQTRWFTAFAAVAGRKVPAGEPPTALTAQAGSPEPWLDKNPVARSGGWYPVGLAASVLDVSTLEGRQWLGQPR
jgi:hypothetical protein